METFIDGGERYIGKYVVEHNHALFGPFDSISHAVAFAMAHEFDRPWALHDLLTPEESK